MHAIEEGTAPVAERFGPYELLELLGRGGMGEVYRAWDTRRQREVAVKVLPPHLASDAQFAARFGRESFLAAQLNEPHIVPIHDYGEIDGRLFIDMRLVEGSDLHSLIADRGALPAEIAVSVVAQIADALDAAHARGLVHRDVKPNNIMLTALTPDLRRPPFAYLVDFGVARGGTDLTSLTSTGTVGTLAYMSPERFVGSQFDHRADVYSLACVLFEALTGRIPFDSDSAPAMMYAHMQREPPQASRLVPGLPRELDEVIASGMAKEPDDRPSSAGALADAARRALASADTAGTTRTTRTTPTAVDGPTVVTGGEGSTADPAVTAITPTRRFAGAWSPPTPTPPAGTTRPPAASFPSTSTSTSTSPSARAAGGRRRPSRRVVTVLSAIVLVAGGGTGVALSRSAGGGDGRGRAASSSPVQAGQAAAPTVVLATDLPLQGTYGEISRSTVDLITLALARQGGRAGRFHVVLRGYDDSSSASGSWDPTRCAANATMHASAKDEVAVIGPFNSGCAKIEVPVLNRADLLMVSDNNTYPGLTKPWAVGEPEMYYPTGTRTYARVTATDDSQGRAAADFAAHDLKRHRCLVLDDGTLYGSGIATAFAAQARADGLTVVRQAQWNPAAPSTYAELFRAAAPSKPDCVYLGGLVTNAGQLIRDKVRVLGDNTSVALLAPDAFTTHLDLDQLTEADGMYFTVAGIATQDHIAFGASTKALLAAYRAKYGSDPVGVYPFYGLAAAQVVLRAIAASDGTRAGVLRALLSGTGVVVPAADSALGEEIFINPRSGDVLRQDVSVLTLHNTVETYVGLQTVR